MSLTVVEKTLEQLLPIQAVTYTLAFNQPVTFRFFHETSLTAFIRTIHKIDPVTLKEKLRIEALESGQVHYNKGDHYHFRVFSLSGDTDILFQITKSLYEASKKSVKSNQGKPLFQGGYTLIAQHDGLSGKRIDSHTELEKYTASSLDEDASLLANTTQYALKFQSACLLTNKSGKNYCRDFNDVKQHNLLKRLLESQWRTLPAEQQKEFSVSKLSEQHQIPDYHPQSGHLVWFDIPYGPKKPNKRIDGLLGKLNLDALPVSQNNIWHKILILGQYLGLGGNINEGQGRYLIELLTQQGSAAIYYKPLPATSQLDRALTYTNINKAIEHTCRRPKDHSHIPYIKEILVKQLKNIRQHQYIVPPLTPVERHKDGKTRLLKIAPLDDRSIQRAVQQQLYKSFESLQHDQSFGYRLGLSRLNAKEHITSKIRELKRKGKQAWVFRSDINSFFDEISHQVARERLEMLYQDDPIIDLIMNWMAAPVQGATSSLENKGLPQGSPISPIVANLILDDFDNDMQHAGLNCIRFADDFVVITDSEKKAQKAQQAAKNSLAEHKITLNSKKTSIRSAADGFQFLGYTFVNDMALDTPRKNKVRYNQKTTQPTKEEDDAPQIKERPSLSYIGEQTAIGQSLIISGSSCLIKIQQNHIIVERDEQLIAESPIGQVQQILLFGQHYLTYPAQKAVLEHNIKLHYSRSGGKYIGSLQSGSPTLSQLNFWQKQRNLFGDEQATLYIVKQIITAKLAHSREV
ncbi:MAG: CRISPR-associated endonuclease Cas1, partial [Cycloclasticus sp.]|nr:CRISPR-associated endonuclease Cas1 [Cycloclasticus sp.]